MKRMKGKWRFLLLPSAYASLALVFVGGVIFFQQTMNRAEPLEDLPVMNVPVAPVVEAEATIVKPFTESNVEIVKNFYDYQAEAAEQEKALVYHDRTFMQNLGVAFASGETFGVLAIYDGTVTEVKQDPLLGNVVKIKHNDDFQSIYASLSNVKVSKGDTVKAGQLIADSGTSELNKDLENHLYLEVIFNGESVNPEPFFNKRITEI